MKFADGAVPPSHERPMAATDVSVLLVFFNRPETFSQVFAQVRLARPARLFLYQDGPRGEQDAGGVRACREIAAGVDWECDVRTCYLAKNQGCDPTMYRAVTWALSMTDKLVILEDDCVPSLSFFPFCKEMLDRYEHDTRVAMVAGFNTDEVTADAEADYFFTSVFSIWGWATWRRVAEGWDSSYTFMHDEYNRRQLEALIRSRRYRPDTMRIFREHSLSGKEYFETIVQAAMLLGSGLAVMPSRNLISNVGFSGGTHYYAAPLQTMPRRLRRMFTMQRGELNFPLRHPSRVCENTGYKDRHYRRNAWGHPWIKAGYSLEELLLNLRYGRFRAIGRAVRQRMARWKEGIAGWRPPFTRSAGFAIRRE